MRVTRQASTRAVWAGLGTCPRIWKQIISVKLTLPSRSRHRLFPRTTMSSGVDVAMWVVGVVVMLAFSSGFAGSPGRGRFAERSRHPRFELVSLDLSRGAAREGLDGNE